MTGFASVERRRRSRDDGRDHPVAQSSIPRPAAPRSRSRWRAIESDVRALVGSVVARGRVELGLSLQLRQAPGVEVEFNEAFGARARERRSIRRGRSGLVARAR